MGIEMVFGRGCVGVRHVPMMGEQGRLELSFLKEKYEVGEPHSEDDNPAVTLHFETIPGLDVLISQLNSIRNNMLKTKLPYELRMGA